MQLINCNEQLGAVLCLSNVSSSLSKSLLLLWIHIWNSLSLYCIFNYPSLSLPFLFFPNPSHSFPISFLLPPSLPLPYPFPVPYSLPLPLPPALSPSPYSLPPAHRPTPLPCGGRGGSWHSSPPAPPKKQVGGAEATTSHLWRALGIIFESVSLEIIHSLPTRDGPGYLFLHIFFLFPSREPVSSSCAIRFVYVYTYSFFFIITTSRRW